MYLSGVSSLFRTYLFTALLSFLVSFNVSAAFSSITEKGNGSALDLKSGGILKIGDNILDFTVKQVKKGTNGKIAIIGRSMGNSKIKGVKDIHKELIKKGNKAEIFDASSLKGEWLERFEDAMDQFADKTNNWTKRLSNQELLQLDMYKLNKEWVKMLKKEGYTILDMGDFNNQGFSAFYAMEKNIIFN